MRKETQPQDRGAKLASDCLDRSADCSRTDTETLGNYRHAMSGRKVTRKGEGTEEEKEKRDGTRRRSAQPPITRCQRRQAVIRRLNSRSSRSVFVRVNLHQVSIFRAFRREAGRREARRGDANGANAGGVSAPKRRRAKSTVTATVINNTSKNNG
ncbi:uncharacterized protein LOC105196115 [Solenopsis invicta]|uniref:uncharacterized protein LOC105196115 n=1 Tax=Solenopsis invicta TaxID=13686 RepID=UPI00193DD484|nr:uncharacterized protein LOC105196115 [Solenopsis invicta]